MTAKASFAASLQMLMIHSSPGPLGLRPLLIRHPVAADQQSCGATVGDAAEESAFALPLTHYLALL